MFYVQIYFFNNIFYYSHIDIITTICEPITPSRMLTSIKIIIIIIINNNVDDAKAWIRKYFKDASNKNAVMPTAQTNKEIRSALMLMGFILIIVEMIYSDEMWPEW